MRAIIKVDGYVNIWSQQFKLVYPSIVSGVYIIDGTI